MLDQSHLLELNEGEQLLASEEHRWYLYLVSGRLDLLGLDRQLFRIQDSDDRALLPLFNEGEHRTCIIARGRCYVAQFDKQLFNTFLDAELLSNEKLETLEMSESEALLFNEIMHDFNTGQLRLPSLPDIAARIETLVSDIDIGYEALVRIITADPAIAIRLIDASHGPHSHDPSSIHDIGKAVEQLGQQTSRRLVMKFAQEQAFRSQSSLLLDRLHQLYDLSIDVAAISRALSRHSGHLSPDYVQLAGLLHEAGTLVILGYIESTGLLLSGEEELEAVIEHLKSAVGSMVIRYWGLPGNLTEVVEASDNWCRDSGDAIDACDFVVIAQIYSCLKHHRLQGIPRFDQVPAIRKLFANDFNREFMAGVLASAHEDIADTMKLLGI